MAQVSPCADAFAYWCLSDIYNQGGYQSSEFQGNYGLLSLHGLRKQGWMAHQLLNRLGTSRLAVQGGTECINAVATRDGNHVATLVYAYPEQFDAAPTRIEIRVAWPFGKPVLTRLGAEENNIIATWKGLGAPNYPTPAQLKELRASNSLKPAPQEAVLVEETPKGQVVVFEMECPGVALLEHV
jgi:xylan 1,4-beta-xylosidase